MCFSFSHSNSQVYSHSPLLPLQVKKKPEAGSEEATPKPPSAPAEKKPAAAKAPAKAASAKAASAASGGGGKGKAKGKAAVGKFDEPPDVPEPSIPVSRDGMFSCVCAWSWINNGWKGIATWDWGLLCRVLYHGNHVYKADVWMYMCSLA